MTSSNKNTNLTQGNKANSSNGSMQNSFGISPDSIVEKAREYNKKVGYSVVNGIVHSSKSSDAIRIASPSGSADNINY